VRRRAAALHNPRPRRAQVVDVLMLHHHDTGNAKGCFVEFDTREDLEKALHKNGTVRQQRARRAAAAARLRRSAARAAAQRPAHVWVPAAGCLGAADQCGRRRGASVAQPRCGPRGARALGVAWYAQPALQA
jgi:hypothetical protein